MAKILVVDDSPTVREATRKALEAAGHEVLTESNGILLPLQIYKQKPDVVLLDVLMPLVSGDTSMKRLRQEDLNSTVVLLHSSKSSEELQQLVEACGAQGFILKTRDAKELVRQVESWLKR